MIWWRRRRPSTRGRGWDRRWRDKWLNGRKGADPAHSSTVVSLNKSAICIHFQMNIFISFNFHCSTNGLPVGDTFFCLASATIKSIMQTHRWMETLLNGRPCWRNIIGIQHSVIQCRVLRTASRNRHQPLSSASPDSSICTHSYNRFIKISNDRSKEEKTLA